jgi:hypothetical protein
MGTLNFVLNFDRLENLYQDSWYIICDNKNKLWAQFSDDIFTIEHFTRVMNVSLQKNRNFQVLAGKKTLSL